MGTVTLPPSPPSSPRTRQLALPYAALQGYRRTDEPTGTHRGLMDQRPTLLRTLITRRHWQVFETFKLHFERTANELAEQDRDPTLVGLTVSKRQFERWYGAR